MEPRTMLIAALAFALTTSAGTAALAATADNFSVASPIQHVGGAAVTAQNATVPFTTAQATASSALANRSNETWRLVDGTLHDEDDYWTFEYVLDGEPRTGEAEVRIDAVDGDVLTVEIDVDDVPADVAESDPDTGPDLAIRTGVDTTSGRR